MLSSAVANQIEALEEENSVLKGVIETLEKRMEQGSVARPKSCQYCKYFVQHYVKGGYPFTKEYVELYEGHCVRGVPVKKRRGKNPNVNVDDTCPFFEIGTFEMNCI